MQIFRQLSGIGIGAKYASSVANIFMAKWEEEVIYADVPENVILYERFLDDCIVIWKGDEASLIQMFDRLNERIRKTLSSRMKLIIVLYNS